jgi:hypothetical protein
LTFWVVGDAGVCGESGGVVSEAPREDCGEGERICGGVIVPPLRKMDEESALLLRKWGSSGPNMLGFRWRFMGGGRRSLSCGLPVLGDATLLGGLLEEGFGTGATGVSAETPFGRGLGLLTLSFGGRGGGTAIAGARGAGDGDLVFSFFAWRVRTFSSSSDEG